MWLFYNFLVEYYIISMIKIYQEKETDINK
jgi:hypothetical protein